MTIHFHSLSNGLRVAVEEMPEIRTASIGVWVNVGARYEKREENGIAHFLEHLAFKGTKTRNALEIAEKIEDIGGYINAYTGREVTNYSAKVLSEHVNIGLDVLSDIILNSTFLNTEIEVEREVIIQEIGMYLDTPDDVVFDWLQDVCYPDQPIGRSILGNPENVKRFGQKDFFNFLRKHYAPKEMIVCVAGGVRHTEVFRIIEEKFGFLDAIDAPKPIKAEFGGGEYRKEKDLEQVHFAFALEAPKLTDPKLYDARVFTSILGGGMSSRLFQQLREKRGLCYSIFSFIETLSDTGSIMIYSGTGRDQVGELSNVVAEELKKLTSNVMDNEVKRAKAQMKAGMLMALENPFSRCERMARSLTIWGRIIDLEEIIEKIEEVNVQKVKDFGLALLNNKKAGLSLYGPITKAPELSYLLSVLNK